MVDVEGLPEGGIRTQKKVVKLKTQRNMANKINTVAANACSP